MHVNDVTEGRCWDDGPRDWVDANCYGEPEGWVLWVISKGGEVVSTVQCQDYPWVRCVREAPAGLILEFGVRKGASIIEISKSGRKVYGFDWWRGLPHSAGGFTKGDCVAQRPSLPDNIELVDGLFSDTLSEFLSAHPEPVAFVNLDCDLYSSSIYVLHCLKDRFVPGSIIALSDIAFSPDAQRNAWLRYLRETAQHWSYLGKNHPWGEVYCKID